MKLTRLLFSSQTLDRGTVRHFSDGDFAIPLTARGSRSYVDSIRLRRPVPRRLAPSAGDGPGAGSLKTRRAGRESRSFLR